MAAQVIPDAWQVPMKFRQRVGIHAGRQRAMIEGGHLLLILHDVPAAGVAERPDFIKIDVEGAEYRVLRGMLGSLARWHPKPVILCEVGWGRRHPQFAEEVAAFDDLAALGYTLRTLDGAAIRIGDLAETTDILAHPTFA